MYSSCGDGMHVGDIAIQWTTDLDAEWIDQHQFAKPSCIAHCHFGCDPATEACAD